jgi:hypothetical protein
MAQQVILGLPEQAGVVRMVVVDPVVMAGQLLVLTQPVLEVDFLQMVLPVLVAEVVVDLSWMEVREDQEKLLLQAMVVLVVAAELAMLALGQVALVAAAAVILVEVVHVDQVIGVLAEVAVLTAHLVPIHLILLV